MDISSIVYGLLMLLVCFSPFIIIAQVKSNKSNKEIKEFKNHGFKYGIELTDVDKWPNHLIGLDSLKKKMLFVEKYENQHDEIILDLHEFKSCEMVRKDVGAGLNITIDRIQLNFLAKNGGSTTVLTFYDSEKNSAMYFEFGLAKKWCELANSMIRGQDSQTKTISKSKEMKLNLA